ncbi:MAG: hypothetical protein ACR2RE_05440, partial [Geminicoccaceae bacterium]
SVSKARQPIFGKTTISDGPISVDRPPSRRHWREEDAIWECLQRAGKEAFTAHDHQNARRRIGEALALARQHFETGDPRIAASLTFQAWLFRSTDPERAGTLFQEAGGHWTSADAWLARQPPPARLAKSSSFHLRLEGKHPGVYQERHLADMKALLQQGRSITRRLQDDPGSLTSPSPSDRSAGLAFDTHRKIKTAIDLLPDRIDPGRPS